MLRWLVRSTVAGSANSDVKSESSRRSLVDMESKEYLEIYLITLAFLW